MNEQQPISPHRRMQELLAIPERQRTEAEWDELNELEISLTPVNREKAPDQAPRRPARAPADRPKQGGGERPRSTGERVARPAGERPRPAGERAKPVEGERPRKPARKFHKRPPKADAP